MPDINTMLNAAYDAYDKVKRDNMELQKMVNEYRQQIDTLQKQLSEKAVNKEATPKPVKKGK